MHVVCRVAFVIGVASTLGSQSTTFDVLVRGARVIDGAGTPWFLADVGIRGDTIAAVGQLGGISAKIVLNAQGLVLSPGFIDPHTHLPETLPGTPLAQRAGATTPELENYLRQGVTTIVDGNDGNSGLPLRPFLKHVESAGLRANFATYVGHGTIREQVMGLANRAATAQELGRMRDIARQSMRDGALGLSTGLFYVPGNYAGTEEIVEMARVVAEFGGVHVSHIRDETDEVVESVAETIRIGEQARIPTHVTHHKVAGVKNWGRTTETLKLIDDARRRGVDVTMDVYPYTASFGPSTHLFPRWALEGGQSALLARLADADARSRIKAAMVRILRDHRQPSEVVIAKCVHTPSLMGKTLADVTTARSGSASLDDVAEAAIGIQEKGGSENIYHLLDETDIDRILRHPATMIGSDGGTGGAVPHPRSFGTFPRIISRYVSERRVLALEEAIRRMTSMTATRLRLYDQGLVRPGLKADLVLFDPAVIADRATFERPTEYAVGVRHVIVNGRFALRDGVLTNERPGRVIRGGSRGVSRWNAHLLQRR